jgi:hypothetical protein
MSKSFFFLLAEKFKQLQEKADNIHVDDSGAQNVVIQLNFLLLVSQNHLGVHQQVDAINDRKGNRNAVGQNSTPQKEEVDQTHQ